jgi:surface protein
LLTFTIQAQFITKWKITDGNEVITIPTTGPGYNYNVNWGDGNSSTATGNVSHTYKNLGIYTISITGTFPRIYFDGTGSKDKIIEISQWGANTWESMNGAFHGCINMNITATDVPVLSGVTDMSNMFYECKKFNPTGAAATAFNNWHTDGVTNMDGMFFGTTIFNQDIGKWNTANVTSMRGMFEGTAAFNQDINSWNTANVTSMRFMFESATAFNGDIAGWKTDKVTDMGYMFWGATAFNQYLGNWRIANSTNMRHMLDNSGLSVVNYDNTLIGWAGEAQPVNIVLGAQNLKYCVGEDARNTLTSIYHWSITGDSLACAFSPGLMPKVFPNPTTGPVRISNIKIGDVILLTDAIGQKLQQELATDETQMLNIHLMAQGIYLISIMRRGKILITAKITKLN